MSNFPASTTGLNSFISLVKNVNFARPNTFLVDINVSKFFVNSVGYNTEEYREFIAAAKMVNGTSSENIPDNDTFGDKNQKDIKKNLKASYIHLLCHATELPGINIVTQPVKVGEDYREVVYSRNFDTLPMTFLVDSTMRIKEFFDAWVKFIKTRTHAAWPDDYKTDIYIYQLEKRTDVKDKSKDVQEMYSLHLFKANPKFIHPMILSNEADGIHKLTVNFEYTHWETF